MVFLVGFFLLVLPHVSPRATPVAFAEKSRYEVNKEIKDLHNKIDAQKSKIDQIQKRVKNYERSIIEFQKQEKNLTNEIAVLDLKTKENEAEIQEVEAQIEQLNLEIHQATLEILEKELYIQEKKATLRSFLIQLEKLGRRDLLDTLVLYGTFSDYYNELKSVDDIQLGINRGLQNLHAAKAVMIENKDELVQANEQLVLLADELTLKKEELENQHAFKIVLVTETQQSEAKYQQLLATAQQEQESANAEIVNLDTVVREKLSELESIGQSATQGMIWPVEPTRGISAYFHDPSYPYRHIFEHSAIDIPHKQGDTIIAPLDGYVARVKSPAQVGTGYAYIMLVHDEGISTVFGHVSCVKVNEDDFVNQGDAIGCVGGAPGTLGAGSLSTGSHLHFEVRKDGIPLNPLNYLP